MNAENSSGYPPLFLACWRGHSFKLDDKDDVDEIKENRSKCVELLLEQGADTDFATHKLQMTAMHWAAYHGDD